VGLAERVPAPAIRWLGRQQFRPYLGRPIRLVSRRLRNRPRVVANGQAKGLRINPAGAHPGYALGTTEPEIQELLAAHVHRGAVVWDIGANVGFYTVIASRLVGDGRVVAFEPSPASCAAIEHNLELNGMTNVDIARVAISDNVGTAMLNVFGGSTGSRLAGEEDSSLAPLDRIEVPVSTLDAQLEVYPAPTLIKMDVEGAEAAALRGAARLLSECKPTLICELHETNVAVIDVLEALGYNARTVERPDVAPRDADWWGAHILATPS
jgi:FkbM family methyltransferase